MLSFFKTRSTGASEAGRTGATVELFRRNAIKAFPLSGEDFAVYVNSERAPAVLPGFVTDFLLSCVDFRPLSGHLETYAEYHGLSAEDAGALQDWLPRLQTLGLLISAAGLRARCAQDTPAPAPQISAIGFPTRDRIALLRRAMESFAANMRAHGRKVPFVVADNSPALETQAACREMLRALGREHSIQVEHVGDDERRRFAGALSRQSGVEPSVVDFALFGQPGAAYRCGMNHNALLLHGAGNLYLTADDDTLCRVAAAPEAREGLALFSEHDGHERYFFEDSDALFAAANFVEKDYLALHEELLGKGTGQCISAAGDRLHFDAVTDEFLKRLDAGDGRVRLTFTGYTGDPGLLTSYFWLHSEGSSFRRLTQQSEEFYHAVLRSRALHTSATSFSIADASLSPGISIGFDARNLLPPFMPALRSEDWIYGATAWRCCLGAFLGHLPFGLCHKPEGHRTIIAPGDWNSQNRAVVWELGHVLRGFILGWRPRPAENSTETRMRGLGRHLRELAGGDLDSFVQCVQMQVLNDEGRRMADLEARIEQDTDAPEYWRRDAREYVDLSRDALNDAAFEVPWEFRQQGRDSESARRLMQSLVFQFGSLLEAWPALFAAAKELRDRGEPLATPV